MKTNTPPTIPCPIAHRVRTDNTHGRHHDLVYLKTVTQAQTGREAHWFECPVGGHRWFIPDFQLYRAEGLTKEFLKRFQYSRPHWGWKK